MATTTELPALDPLDLLATDALLDDEERAIRDTVRQFVRDNVLPEIGDWFEQGILPRELMSELAKLGLYGMHLDGYGLPGASAVAYGLTAGIYAWEEDDLDLFLDRAQAGVLYANRVSGATTGAWPGVQPFGGWKGSGTTGKAGGGPYYVTQYMREQSRTVIEE